MTAPTGEGEAAIKSRLVTRTPRPATRAAFVSAFDPAAFAAVASAVQSARAAVGAAGTAGAAGATAAATANALQGYREALRLERDNWLLLQEAGEVALMRARDLDLAEMLIGEALRINPWYAATAWNLRGDVDWLRGDLDAAQRCYDKAIAANPEDHRGYMNLHIVYRQRRAFGQAIQAAARALALDVAEGDAAKLRKAVDETVELLAEQRRRAATNRRQRRAGSPV